MEQGTPTSQHTEHADTRPYVVTILSATEAGDAFSQMCVRHGSSLTHERPARKVRLAYPIGKNHFASFFSFDITAVPSSVLALHTELKREPNVIRALVERKRVSMVRETSQTTEVTVSAAPREERPRRFGEAGLTNEDLQKKIEEILN
jgi:ribosomal protein S6